MADDGSVEKVRCSDLGGKSSDKRIIKIDDNRVPRERHKKFVDSCDDDVDLCWWMTLDDTNTRRLVTPSSSTTSTSTAHRRRTTAVVIGDAGDDRRRDGVVQHCACDDSRNNDNNENNEERRCDVAASVALLAMVEEEEEEEEVEREIVEGEEGEEAEKEVAPKERENELTRVVGEGAKAVAGAASESTAVVSRLEPAASEDRLRSGKSVGCDVATTAAAIAAGFETDNAFIDDLSSRNNNNNSNNIVEVQTIDNFVILRDRDNEIFVKSVYDGRCVDYSFNDEALAVTAAAAAVVRVHATAAAVAVDVLVSCAANSGENGEWNSDISCVDNDTRRKGQIRSEEEDDKAYYEESFLECRENERDYNESDNNGRRPGTRSSVLLVEKFITNNNNNNNHSKNVIDKSKLMNVRDFRNIDDKVQVENLNFVRERSPSVFINRAEKVLEVVNDVETTFQEDLLVRRNNGAMQTEPTTIVTTTTTTTTTTATKTATTTSTRRKEEMAEREIVDGVVVARLGSPFKGQIRTAEDTLVGPCGKKRCADRYDSSESSDSGVAISCGDCSSSGTSDITEPGSPCSTSSDEGLVIRGTAPSPLPTLLKLAPTTPPSHSGTRPQWPWTPPLAATACSTYKRLKGEPEAGTLPKAGAADPTARSGAAGGVKQQSQQQQSASGKTNHNHHHHHESQGKITEYFKAQIKPQQPKLKKNSNDMSLLVAKNSPEFRRPPTVQRNKGGLAKYLGVVLPNGRTSHDRGMRTITISPPPMKNKSVVTPRNVTSKMEKKMCPNVLSGLPISSDVLSGIPGCKISSLRLVGEASPKPSGVSPPATPTAALMGQPDDIDFSDVSPAKPIVNENNNLTNGCTNARQNTLGLQEHPLTRLSSGVFDVRERKEESTSVRAEDDDDDEEEEDDSRSGQSKAPSSPILSAPTTIRFPARAPEKKGPRGTDSGICQWDKCEGSFECSGALLEHLQAAHINTQQGGDNFVCHWQGCKVQGRTSCSRRWLERHVLSHGGNKPFRCIVDGCGSRFSSQTALERHVNSHFNQPETSSSSGRRSCESGGKLVRRNGKKLRYRRQPWSARLFDYIDTGVMEGLQHRLLELAKTRTQGRLAETPGNSMALTSQVLARRVELDGKAKVLLRWYPQDIAPDEWVLESEVQSTKHIGIRDAATKSVEEVNLVLYPAVNGGTPPQTRTKQRRKPAKNS